jgi:flagellar biosynthesis anti-sigma factor FlgM
VPDPIQGVNIAAPFNMMSGGRHTAPQIAAFATPQSSADSGIDWADVGQTAALLKSIAETASSVPDVDLALVASLQQAVQSGTIPADPQQIAESFMELEALLA